MSDRNPDAIAILVGVLAMLILSAALVLTSVAISSAVFGVEGRWGAKAGMALAIVSWVAFFRWCGVRFESAGSKVEPTETASTDERRSKEAATTAMSPSRPWNLPRKRKGDNSQLRGS